MGLAKLITKVIDAFYIKPIPSIVTRQTFRYAVCGGTNMALDIILYYVAYNFIFGKEIINLNIVAISPYIAALIVIYPIIFFNGFWLNKNIAFSQSPIKTRTQLLRYAASTVGAILLNYICMKIFVDTFEFWATPSKALTTVISIVYSYLMARLYTFKES